MITGPTGIFGENQDYKTVIRESFANDLAHTLNELTVPLRDGGGGQHHSAYFCLRSTPFYYLF